MCHYSNKRPERNVTGCGTNSLNRTLSRSPRGGGAQVSSLPTPRGGKSSKTLMDRSTNVCFCMISSVGVCFNDGSWAQGGPGIQFLHMQRFIWFAKGREKKNWIYSLVRGALWRQLRRLTALFFTLASPRSNSTKLQCCYQGENELTVPKVC